MEWAQQHPIKTNADRFKEDFGIDTTLCECAGILCPDNAECNNCPNKNFWEKPYKEAHNET